MKDLSYSNLVNTIQSDEKVGGDLIHSFAIERGRIFKEIEEKEAELTMLKLRHEALHDASIKIAQHLKRGIPLGILRDEKLCILRRADFVIESNLI